jgi:hypothetical protein
MNIATSFFGADWNMNTLNGDPETHPSGIKGRKIPGRNITFGKIWI